MGRESYGGGGQYGGGSSSNSGGNGDSNREQYGAVGQYSGNTTSTSTTTDNKDPTVQYNNFKTKVNLTKDQKKTLEAQRQKARYEISPMTDPKNKLTATALSIMFGPLYGSLYGRYKDATAMGFSPTISNMIGFDVSNLSGLLDNGSTTPPSTTNTGGEGDEPNSGINISNIVAAAPSIIQGNTQEPSVAAAWYKNLGTTSGWDPFSTNSLFKNARAKQQSILGTATGIGQMAVNESPFFNFLKDNSINKGIL